MDASEYRRLSQIEDHHWWFRSIHRLVMRVVQGQALRAARPGPVRILDAGCGTGGLMEKLASIGRVIGLDRSSHALSYAKETSRILVQGSVNNLPFRDGSFDVVTSISVLYHDRVDDRTAWAEMRRVLQQGGMAIVVLPAFPWLAGQHDRAVHTKHRYTRPEVMRMATSYGFEILDGRYLFSLLFPIFVIKRFAERLTGVVSTSDLFLPPSWFNVLLERLCALEWQLARVMRFPFGSSLLLIVKKVQ